MKHLKKKKVIIFIGLAIIVLLFSVGTGLALNGYFGGAGTVLGDTTTRALVGYWDFEEGIGASANDSSDSNNDLTLVSTPAWSTGNPSVYTAGALDFESGSSQYGYAADSTSLSITSNLTITSWIKPESVTASTLFDIAGKWDGTNESYLLAQFGDEIRMYVDSSSNYKTTDAANLSTATWYYVAAVYNASAQTVTIYINGIDTTGTVTGTIPTSIGDDAGRFHIGAEDSTTTAANFYDGIVDEPRLYNRLLSAAEIRYLYNHGGPVAHYKMDEGSGSTAYDASNIANDGTTTGATYVAGQYGTALDFDGTDDEISVTNANPIDFDLGLNDGVTFSAWINADGAGEGGVGRILDKGTNTWLRVDTLSGGRLDLQASIDLATTDATLNVSSAVAVDTWHHVVMVWEDDSDDELSIYVDGILVGTSTDGSGGPVATDTNSLIIGGDSGITANFDGTIDDFRVYQYSRTAAEIRLDYNQGFAAEFGPSASSNQDLTRGLVGYLNFDEGTGQTANDSSDSNNDGTLGANSSAASDDPTWTSSKAGLGGALDYDGGDHVRIADAATVELDGNFTISFWFNNDVLSGGNHNMVFSKSDADTCCKLLYITQISGAPCAAGIKLVFYLRDDAKSPSSFTLCSNTTIATNTWYHGVWTFDGTTRRMYLNGVEESSDSPWVFAGNNQPILLGQYTTSNATLNIDGKIDEPRIYNRALTASEIRYLYNRGGPVAHYKMDEGSGSTAYDASNIANDGTITGAIYAAGQYGTALDFDGTDDNVNVADTAALDYGDTDDMTISGWFNRDTATSDDVIVAKRNSLSTASDTGYIAYLDATADTLIFEVSDGTDEYSLTSSSTFTSTGWNHFSIVWDQDSAAGSEIYINGTANSATDTGTIGNIGSLSNAVALRIATESDGGSPFDGKIDDFRIY